VAPPLVQTPASEQRGRPELGVSMVRARRSRLFIRPHLRGTRLERTPDVGHRHAGTLGDPSYRDDETSAETEALELAAADELVGG